MEYKIEKGLPIPKIQGIGGLKFGVSKYPLSQLDVGDSFSIPLLGSERKCRNNGGSQDRAPMNLASAISNYYKTHKDGKKFTIRTIKDEGVVRCWRIA